MIQLINKINRINIFCNRIRLLFIIRKIIDYTRIYKMDKRTLILDAAMELMKEDKDNIISVNDIAKRAGIAKGGIYYYFKSKEEILDALVDRIYHDIIANCNQVISTSNKNALDKLNLLFHTYYSFSSSSVIDTYLHAPNNAAVHQKSLAKILLELTPLLTKIIEAGIKENLFSCDYPKEYAEIMLSAFTFLLDPGIFKWSTTDIYTKILAISSLIENSLNIKQGSIILIK